MMTRFRTIRRNRGRSTPLTEVAVYDHVAAAFRRRTPGVPPGVMLPNKADALHDAATGKHLAVAEALIAALLAKGYRR